MTTPTREQVVQWVLTASNPSFFNPIREAPNGNLEFGVFTEKEMTDFATLARADLEATIAEQAAEIDRLRVIERYVQKGETYSYGIRVGIESKAEEFAQLRQQLTEQSAHIERLRECLINIQNNPHKTNWIIDWCAEALATVKGE